MHGSKLAIGTADKTDEDKYTLLSVIFCQFSVSVNEFQY